MCKTIKKTRFQAFFEVISKISGNEKYEFFSFGCGDKSCLVGVLRIITPRAILPLNFHPSKTTQEYCRRIKPDSLFPFKLKVKVVFVAPTWAFKTFRNYSLTFTIRFGWLKLMHFDVFSIHLDKLCCNSERIWYSLDTYRCF